MATTNWAIYYGVWPIIVQNLRVQLKETSSVIRIMLSIVFLLIVILLPEGNAYCLESDRRALVDFKSGLDDPKDRLASWKGESCCQWSGIACNNKTGAVIAIDLRNPNPSSSEWRLGGKISPSLTKLMYLRHLDLSFNSFNGILIPKFLEYAKNLRYLNLSKAGFSGDIPPNLGNLSSLQYLDLSSYYSVSAGSLDWLSGLQSLKYLQMEGTNLSKVGSDWIVPLNKLPSLSELHLSFCGLSSFKSSLNVVNFTSLAVIDLSSNDFHSEIPNWLSNISSLESINLRSSNLYGTIPLGLTGLQNLRSVDLGGNVNLTANCSQLFAGSWRMAEYLNLEFVQLHGELPATIGNMTSLRFLRLIRSGVEGGLPSSIGKLCNLIYLELSVNNLTKSLPKFLQVADNCGANSPLPSLRYLILENNKIEGELPNWLSQLRSLATLSLGNNLLQGPIPASLGTLLHLSELWLQGNRLNGSLPDSLGQLSELLDIDVSSNNLTGIITEVHFSKLSKLLSLDLSSNSFILNVSSDWVPPFQVEFLSLRSCRLGPSFPYWLKSQREVNYLDFSKASILGPIPNWFWDLSGSMYYFNLSFNQLQGQLPNPLNVSANAEIDLSSNILKGSIPLPSLHLTVLALSNNEFSGPIPETIGESLWILSFLSLSGNQLSGSIPESVGLMSSIGVIDLSRNYLTGRIPSSIANSSKLQVLDLQNNNLSGEIPSSLGGLYNLRSLHISNNNISGEIPLSFKTLLSLETLDLGNNGLTGEIPPWFGDRFPYLRILSLRSNRFFGEIPSSLSKLSSLQVLDLAENNFNGRIPITFGKFQSMTRVQKRNDYLFYGLNIGHYYEESYVVILKNQSQEYTRTLSLMTSIDLSGNNISGELPEEISRLVGLIVLNLSGNHISGQIPPSISKLQQLSSLDLSDNGFSGPIPPGMSSLDFLGYLNLSNNKLSGKIPYLDHLTTFDASSFGGNSGLCGAPLIVMCQVDDSDEDKKIDIDSRNSSIDTWILYLSIVLGFVAGISVPYTVIAIRRSWWDAYMGYVDKTADKLSYLGHKVARRCRNNLKHN